MPWGRGRGYRRRYWATGVPGRAFGPGGGPGWGRGGGRGWRAAMGGNCDFYPWLPRGWWSGAFGPVTMTDQGPQIASQSQVPMGTPIQPAQEVDLLKQEKQALEEDLKAIKEDLKSIDERMKEIKSKTK